MELFKGLKNALVPTVVLWSVIILLVVLVF